MSNGVPIEELADRVSALTRENENLFRRLLDNERKFRGLARAVWRVQEEERRRLARELHDGVGQTLTALKIHLELLAQGAGDPPSGQPADAAQLGPRLAEAIEIAALTLKDLRHLSHQLRPQILDDLGLLPALQWLVRTFREWTRFEVAIEHSGLEERLDPDLETVAFRVVQEALNNARKHAGTGGATLEVERARGRLTVRVSDLGEGFDVESMFHDTSASAGSGLRGLRDRVELFGGGFRVHSSPGEGTTLEAVLPVGS